VAVSKKKARSRHAWLIFQDESGVTQRPSIRRTWAPRGQTPVLIHPFNWKKMSLCAGIAYRWDGKRSRLYFQSKPDNYDVDSLQAFIMHLKRHLRGAKAILIWDGLPAHKSRAMKDWLNTQRPWLDVALLPGYSPDLNPVEGLWNNIKGQELANRCCDDLGEIAVAVNQGIDRVRGARQLMFGFLHEAELFF
jgi:hypothetical protein